MTTQGIGRVGEDLAASYLQKCGYRILQRNFRSKFGEIDIVAQDKNTLVFVEVKTRYSHEYGYPEEAVTTSKIRSIIKTAHYYKLKHTKTPGLMRIDVVAIDMLDNTKSIRHIKNITQ